MTSVFLFLPTLLIALVIGIIVLISGLFCQISGAILEWIMSPGFISLSYTSNEIVNMGLDITKDFVNLFLVVFLVFIALSIALKIGDFPAKKVFAKLILVALLVNFAPVFVGLIVDAANIVMNFFLEGIRESVSEIGTGVTNFGSGVTKVLFSFSGNLSERAGLLMQAVTQIVVNLAMGLAFFLFAAIFLIRYVVIWVLTILSPLAFVFWILPATKRFWDMWWQQLIQWSIVGIPISFFLYLAMNSFAVLQQTFVGKLNMPGIETTTVGWLDQVFPFFVIIIFLFLGFTVGLQTGAMGAKSAIGFTSKYGFKAGKGVGRGTKALAGRAISSKVGEKMKLKERLEKASSLKVGETWGKAGKIWDKGGKVGGAIGKGLGWATGLTPAAWALRRGVGQAGLKMTESGIKDIKTTESKYSGTTAERKASAIRDTRFGWSHRIAALNQAIEEGQVGDIKKLGITEDEITNIGKASLRVHPDTFKKIRNTFPHLAEKMGQDFSEATRKKADLVLDANDIQQGITVPMKIMMKIKPDLISKMDESALLDTDVQTYFHEFAKTDQVSALLTQSTKKVKDLYIAEIKNKGLQWYEQHRPDLANYFKSNPGIRVLGEELT